MPEYRSPSECLVDAGLFEYRVSGVRGRSFSSSNSGMSTRNLPVNSGIVAASVTKPGTSSLVATHTLASASHMA